MKPRAARKLRALAGRIDAATPPHRDRSVDALRALAIAGVIIGHWMVTALVISPGQVVHDASPLASLPALTPVSWIFQTLAIFFLVGGYAAARSFTGGYLSWLRTTPGQVGPSGGGPGRRLGAARHRAPPGRDLRCHRPDPAHAGAQSALVPGRTSLASRP